MTRLPTWASTPAAQALLQAIVAERPEPNWHRERGMFPHSYPRYANKNVGALRLLHDRLCEEALAVGDKSGDYTVFRDLARMEPDDIVFEMLREADEGLTEVEHLGPGRIAA